jgi:hypothetical protein
MTRYAIKRATPRTDFTVAIEWADGSSSKVDFRPEIARGGALASLGEPAVFLWLKNWIEKHAHRLQ